MLLLEFLHFYGYELDYVGKSIIVYSPHFAEFPVGSNVFELSQPQDAIPKLLIYDPINPTNIVSRSTYRIILIKQLFMLAFNKLLYNRRCGTSTCKERQGMNSEELKTSPCCILKRMLQPEVQLVTE